MVQTPKKLLKILDNESVGLKVEEYITNKKIKTTTKNIKDLHENLVGFQNENDGLEKRMHNLCLTGINKRMQGLKKHRKILQRVPHLWVQIIENHQQIKKDKNTINLLRDDIETFVLEKTLINLKQHTLKEKIAECKRQLKLQK